VAMMSKLHYLFLIILLCVLCDYQEALAATINASSCSASDVQTAMNSASAGDTVVIPACSGGTSWTTQVSWTAPANVTLKGAGTSAVGGGDQTVIVDDYNANAKLLKITVSSTGTFRMTGITFKGGSSGALKDNGVIAFTGPGTVRIDHCHFDTRSYTQDSPARSQKIVVIGDRVYGVIDHCILDLYGASAVYVFNGAGTDSQGNNTWAADTDFGTSDFFFFEDNQVNGYPSTSGGYETRLFDGWSAARAVIRFNSFHDSCALEEHGTGHAGGDRGVRAVECYGNKSTESSAALNAPNGPNFTLLSLQSGTALVWGNEAVNCYKNGIVFRVTRKDDTTYSQTATPNGWGYCGTDFNGTGSDWDENSSAGTGYACLDQPGRGKGDLLTGNFPNKINDTTNGIDWPNQALEPVYTWNNNISVVAGWGGAVYKNQTDTTSGYRVQSDRDYYEQASGVQTSQTNPFDGTSGVGWGTLANRPTTCTKGVAYFATDQGSWNESSSNPYGVQQNGADGVLYKCTATNTWTLYYTPYTYPHPLNAGQKMLKGCTLIGVSLQ